MYESFYGLRERAFELTPDPRFLLLTPAHREALSNLEYGITFRRGITLLIGEAGTGKTTLLRKALPLQTESHGKPFASVYLNNPALTRSEFLEFLAERFHLSTAAAYSKTRLLREIEVALVERRTKGETTVLVIDEAQSLSHELLEEIRLLANIESDTEKLLPLILVGQPELGDRLNEPELRQLKQRVALRCSLAPLTLPETAAYVAGRIRLAGGNAAYLFSRDAIIAVYEHSRGIPRTISVICDNALLTGFAAERRPVDTAIIDEVCGDFDLERAVAASASACAAEPPEPPPNVRPFMSPPPAPGGAHGARPQRAQYMWESR